MLRKKKKSIVFQIKKILGVLCVIVIVYAITGTFLINRFSNQTFQEINAIFDLYIEELDNRFFRVSRYLIKKIMDKEQPDTNFYMNISKLENEPHLTYPIENLREDFLSCTWEYGVEYHFFLYMKELDCFYQMSLTKNGGYDMRDRVKQILREQINQMEGMTYSARKKWNIVSDGDENYLCKIAWSNNVYLGCYVNAVDLLETFDDFSLGENGYIQLLNKENVVLGMLHGDEVTSANVQQDTKEKYLLKQFLSQAPLEVRMKMSSNEVWKRTEEVFSWLIFISMLLVLIDIFLLEYVRRNLMNPIMEFHQKIENFEVEEEEFQLTNGNLLELERVDDKISQMIQKIRGLRIELYEQELEKQKMEMEYLKLQIRPHFFLNCLNFISCMIELEQYEYAQRMDKITVNYMAYIFRNNREWVPIHEELKHCQDFLEIQLLRYPESLNCYVEVNEEVEETLIPAFLLQIFVENAAIHGLTLNRKISISITAYPEERFGERYVNIFISDNGNGFLPAILEKLNKGEYPELDGKHIGISNCMKRFRYYYREKGEVRFSNSPLGGAVVDIHIPYIVEGGSESK